MNQLSDEMQALYRRTGTAMLNRFMACESLTTTDIGAEIIRRGLALDCARFSGSEYRRHDP
jgi:hypothetical protein